MDLDSRLKRLGAIFEHIRSKERFPFLSIIDEKLTTDEVRFDRTGRLAAWIRLKQAAESIQDITNHRSGLAYVGFLGHFSSGKSTLINAILGNPSQRPTSKNPTDTLVTLVCQPNDHSELIDNSFNSVRGIRIETAPIKASLAGIVLVDTPGLGNTDAEHELAERFLHLCHVVVITIDGMVPLADTESDFRLLDKALNRLAAVPKIYAITKAFTFLTSRKGDYATDWDQGQVDELWSGIVARISRDPRFSESLDALRHAQVICVDSLDGYNVDVLLERLCAIARDPNQRPRVYVAQAEYLIQTGRDAIKCFQQFLLGRLTNLEHLQKEASRKASEAHEMLNRRTDGVSRAIETATGRISDIGDPVRLSQAELEFPKPTIVSLGDPGSGFAAAIREMTDHVSTWRDKVVERAAASALQQATSMARFGALRQKAFATTLIVAACDEAVPHPTGGQASSWLLWINDYSERATRQVEREIPSRWHIETSDVSGERIRVAFREAFQALSGGLGTFMSDYNVTARAFVAYLTQPDSKRLLRECGVILFDEADEERALKAAETTIHDFASISKIDALVQEIRDKLLDVERNERQQTDDANRQLVFHPPIAPVLDGAILQAILDDDAYRLLLRRDLDEFAKSAGEDAVALVGDIGLLRQSLAQRLRAVGTKWLVALVRAMVIAFGAYLLLRIIEAASSDIHSRLWTWLTSNAGPFLLALAATVVVEISKSIFRDTDLDKYSLGLWPLIQYLDAKREKLAQYASRVATGKATLSMSVNAHDENVAGRVYARTSALFEEFEQNRSVVEMGRTLKSFQKERVNIYEDGRQRFATYIAEFRQELAKNPKEKRKESVDRVLDRITKTKEAVRGFSDALDGFDRDLRSP